MSTLNQETRPTAHPEAVSSRRLFKGRLSPPAAQPTRKSYTLAPASISEVFIKDPAEKQATTSPIQKSSDHFGTSSLSHFIPTFALVLTTPPQVAAPLPSLPELCLNPLWTQQL
ncbi:hypothetical protein F5X98DRAFT_369384 [Xylaria grammica]|nr:hypothetical protein F5X98DRAFT_369384 [Xylaria grammica]